MRGAIWAVSAAATAAVLLSACMARPWTEHKWPAWGFAVSYPGAIAEQPGSPGGPGVPPLLFAVDGVGEDKDLSVAVVDLRGSDMPEDQAINAAVERVSQGRPTQITYWATGDKGEHMGRSAVIDQGAGMFLTVHVAASNGRLYEISGRSMGKDSPKVTKFLYSFRLIEPPAPAPAAP